MAARPRVIVGVDGSDPASRALEWAVHEARLMDATLEIVNAWLVPPVPVPFGYADYPGDPAPFETAAKELLEHIVGEHNLVRRVPPERLQVVAREGSPAHALLECAGHADLLVVGARGHGGLTGLLLGSVSIQCATHAPCPVTVVPPDWDHRSTKPRRVVVGVDGSDASQRALDWAAAAAARRGTTLRVVNGLMLTAPAVPYRPAVWVTDYDRLRRETVATLHRMASRALDRLPEPPTVEYAVVDQSARVALMTEAENADLLVVGSRGRGGFASLLLGSVSQYCLHHAPCPITIVRPELE